MPAAGFSHSPPTDVALRAAFEDRFIPEPMSGCWLWIGNVTVRGGYGVFTCRPAGLMMVRANRLSWMIYRGPIDKSQHVLHHCDNVLCVNPDHLFLGDQLANMRDKLQKRRQNKGESHGLSKLTDKQALAIRVDLRPLREIAVEYGVSITTVSEIRNKRHWQHL